MTSIYRMSRVRGGKDDSAIERSLSNREENLRAGSTVEIRLDRISPWEKPHVWFCEGAHS